MAILGGNKSQNTGPATPPPAAPPAAPVATPAPVKAAAAPVKSAPAKRGPKPGTERKPLTLDLGGLEVATVTDPQEMAKARRTRGERSADQKRLDAMVESAWQNWKNAGEPTSWPKMPGVKVKIDTSKYETLVSGIRKAGQFYDLRVRFGKPSESNGVTEVVFVVTDKPEKDDENSDDDTDNES